MEQIKATTLRRALNLLDACGFQYAVIDSDGVKHGALEIAAPKTGRAKSEFPHGSIAKYIRGFIPEQVAVGDVIEVPVNEYGHERIRGGLLNLLSGIYGIGKFTSVIDGDNVQVMRVEE